MIYLCHKCSGHLTTHNPNGVSAYACHCISGYVRDWQSPTKLDDVRGIQQQQLLGSLELYKSQGRPDDDHHVKWARDKLAQINKDNLHHLPTNKR
jgi:hypothetical protein